MILLIRHIKFFFIQEINIHYINFFAGVSLSSCSVVVTALVVSRGLLWVGTSVGVTLTLPLPRLQGVPIISGRPTLSYHAHTGPVTFLMTLMPQEYFTLPKLIVNKTHEANGTKETLYKDVEHKQTAADGTSISNDSNKEITPPASKHTRIESMRKACTLPRGFGGVAIGATLDAMENSLGGMPGALGGSGPGGSDDGEVMGLCGDLLRHWSDESTVACGEGEAADALRRSDPSLSCMTSTLDRRLRLRAGRPRSLDLSSASIDSKVSAATTVSSCSEDCSHSVYGRQRTIRENLTNDTIPESELSRKNSAQDLPPEIAINDSKVSHEKNTKMAQFNKETISPARESAPNTIESNSASAVISSEDTTSSVLIPTKGEETQKYSITVNAHMSDVESSKTVDAKKRSSHKRSSSDVTPKGFSSSTSNISSLYYEGDTDTFIENVITNKNSTVPNEMSNSSNSKSKEGGDHVSRKSSITSTLNRNGGTLNRSATNKSAAGAKGGNGQGAGNKVIKEAEQPRTILVLVGGQGYKCMREDMPSNGPPHNNTDAHILVWEMKL